MKAYTYFGRACAIGLVLTTLAGCAGPNNSFCPLPHASKGANFAAEAALGFLAGGVLGVVVGHVIATAGAYSTVATHVAVDSNAIVGASTGLGVGLAYQSDIQCGTP